MNPPSNFIFQENLKFIAECLYAYGTEYAREDSCEQQLYKTFWETTELLEYLAKSENSEILHIIKQKGNT